MINPDKTWEHSYIQFFWNELASGDDMVQLYESRRYFINTLEGFAGCGLLSGDNIVIIATAEHLEQLESRLLIQGFNTDELKTEGRYLPFEAGELLSTFYIDGWLDSDLFNKRISKIIRQATQNGKKVRIFSEMVALLWKQGNQGATVYLEHLWHRLQIKNKFPLYSAYPKSGFQQGEHNIVNLICRVHNKIISGKPGPSTEIHYKSLEV